MTELIELEKEEQTSQKNKCRTPRVLISVLSFNSIEDTKAAINSLSKQNWPAYKLQLIDNASQPGFTEQIQKCFPELQVMALPENLGYTGGNNVALRQALEEGYEYVLITNHDIEVDENALSCLIETAETHSDAGLVGGVEVCYFTGETVLVQRTGFSFWRMRPNNSDELPQTDSAVLQVPNVQGALILFTRRALEAGLRWDEQLFMYYDEIDMGLEMERLGLRAYVDTRVKVQHKNKVKWFNPVSGYFQQRNRVYLVRKQGRWYHVLLYLCYSTLLEVPVKMLVRSLQGYLPFALACFLGQVDGLLGHLGKGRVAQLQSKGRK